MLPVHSHNEDHLQPERHSQGYVLAAHSPSNSLGQNDQRQGDGLQVGCGQHKPVLRPPAALQRDERCQPCNALQGARDENMRPATQSCSSMIRLTSLHSKSFSVVVMYKSIRHHLSRAHHMIGTLDL